MKHCLFLLITFYLCTPLISQAQVLISEVAWMGTDTNAAHEWIEIYNLSLTPTNISGWTLQSDDGAVSIALSGTLNPHGVALLERDTDAAIPDVAALLTYTGEMLDTGGVLTLKNASGTIADVATGGVNWSSIGGSKTIPKKTAQRTRRAGWVTATPTPGNDNAQTNELVVNEQITLSSTSTSTLTTQNVITRRSGGGSSKVKKSVTLAIIASTTSSIGSPVTFSVQGLEFGKNKKKPLEYSWNFGDATVDEGAKTEHTFMFPGEYIVIVEATSTNKRVQARHDIKILPSRLSLAITKTGNLAITNDSNSEIILDGYSIVGNTLLFTFPKNSIVKAQASITLASLEVKNTQKFTVSDPAGVVVASLTIGESTMLTPPGIKSVTHAVESKQLTSIVSAPVKFSPAYPLKKSNAGEITQIKNPDTGEVSENMPPAENPLKPQGTNTLKWIMSRLAFILGL